MNGGRTNDQGPGTDQERGTDQGRGTTDQGPEMNHRPVLELIDATVIKDGVRVLDGLTLTIRALEHTAIVGPNGAGKTTLINLLTQDDHALARGDGPSPVRAFGKSQWNVFELRSELGIVSGDLHQQ